MLHTLPASLLRGGHGLHLSQALPLATHTSTSLLTSAQQQQHALHQPAARQLHALASRPTSSLEHAAQQQELKNRLPLPWLLPAQQARSFSVAVPEPQPDTHEGKRMFGPGQEGDKPKKTFDEGYIAPHPGIAKDVLASSPPEVKESYMEHQIWYDKEYLESVHPVHLPPKNITDKVAYATVRLARSFFDKATGYGPQMNEAKWLQRTIFLETVAGVPGMVAGMLRHLRSLRAFSRDNGWIHCLLEEAENERMHLLTFLQLRQPSPLFRFCVIGAQGIFFNMYFIVYLLWPKVCHAFVGYLEEEAVRTYTHLIHDIDKGTVWKDVPAPKIGKDYWMLPENATMRDLILAVRADEACHSHVNHTLKTLKPDEPNPFVMGKSQAP